MRNKIFKNLNIQDGGWRPSWKLKNCDILKTVWTILLKFFTMTPAVLKINFFFKSKMADGYYFKNCYMQYFSNRLTNIYEICMVMHIRCFNPNGDQNIWKFRHLKIQDCGQWLSQKSKNMLHLVCPILTKLLQHMCFVIIIVWFFLIFAVLDWWFSTQSCFKQDKFFLP